MPGRWPAGCSVSRTALENQVNEATLAATRRKSDSVTLANFTVAVERIVAGLKRRNRLLNPAERRTVAFHEMGHALVALAQKASDPVHKVSIIPRGIGTLGCTIQRPTQDRYLMSQPELERKVAVLLGGRAAQALLEKETLDEAAVRALAQKIQEPLLTCVKPGRVAGS